MSRVQQGRRGAQGLPHRRGESLALVTYLYLCLSTFIYMSATRCGFVVNQAPRLLSNPTVSFHPHSWLFARLDIMTASVTLGILPMDVQSLMDECWELGSNVAGALMDTGDVEHAEIKLNDARGRPLQRFSRLSTSSYTYHQRVPRSNEGTS